jgi:hypothetical protein
MIFDDHLGDGQAKTKTGSITSGTRNIGAIKTIKDKG